MCLSVVVFYTSCLVFSLVCCCILCVVVFCISCLLFGSVSMTVYTMGFCFVLFCLFYFFLSFCL